MDKRVERLKEKALEIGSKYGQADKETKVKVGVYMTSPNYYRYWRKKTHRRNKGMRKVRVYI